MQVMVNGETYKTRIYDLAVAAAEDLTQKAYTLAPLWTFEEEKETQTLNVPECKRRFESLDSTLEEVIGLFSVREPTELSSELSKNAKLINGQQPDFKTEAFRETEIVPMNPINIVDVFIDVEQWSLVFCDIVSEVSVLGVLSNGEGLGNPNGALQVVKAEFRVASPLLKTREIYFGRYCKQMTVANTWVVVDVSLLNPRP
ncbi:homeobox-leucine zipper protein MERISTEM L1-like isoform X1 [Apium graveolens]|uniref:homeobox-leucine zipper protein MERISTEM L1-like isoform X1 n=1 Tax=Apium graveolens TaxID=4045 RepID=UPI003D7A7652